MRTRILSFFLLLSLSMAGLLPAPVSGTWPGSEFSLTVDVEPAAGGSVQIGTLRPVSYPYIGTYVVDTMLEITAVPAAGYSFAGWSGSSQEMNATISVTMSCSQYLVADFQPITYTANTNVPNSDTGLSEKPLVEFPVWLGIVIVVVILGGFIVFLKLNSRH